MNKFGKNLRQIRIEKGLTQTEVANILKFESAQLISNVERGTQSLATKHFKKLSKVLGLPVKTLAVWKIKDYAFDLHRSLNL